METSYGLWWIELVAVLVVLMGLGIAAREAAAFISIGRMRQRDGGVPIPRTREEYLLLFPRACPQCLSRRGKKVAGWYRDQYGADQFVDTWQCAECGHAAGGRELSAPVPGRGVTEQPVMARPRWFVAEAEAARVERPRRDRVESQVRS